MKKNKNQWFKLINDIPIRQKMILIYVVFILVPMLLVYFVFFSQLRAEVALRESNVVNQSMDRVASDIDYLVDSCFSIARDIAVDQEINEMIDTDYITTVSYFDVYYEKLRDQIQMYATSYNNVIKVSIFTDNKTVLNGGNIYYLSDEIRSSAWYKKVDYNNFQETILSWVENDKIQHDVKYHRISVVRKMDEFTQYDKEMYVRIDIDESKFKNILQETYNMDFVITDTEDGIIADSFKQQQQKKYEPSFFKTSLYDEANSLFEQMIHPTKGVGWQLIAIVPKQTLSNEINRYALLVALMLLVSLIFSMFFIMIFSRSYNTRIQMLQRHMHKVENSEFVTIEGEQGKDEIGGLIRAFNQMTRRINGLVNEVLRFTLKEKEHQLQQVKAELKFLQSQMDPHFLFNTLNAILVVSSRFEYHEITDIIKYLSKTLRYLIEWDNSMVPLEKELAFTSMYLEIEKFRFRDKFDFVIETDESLHSVLIPKLSIQPFVENACKHGLQATKAVGKLVIRIKRLNESLYVAIEDNGIGMTKEKLQSVLENQSDAHIGINNVLKRLHIYYGDAFNFHMNSNLGTGTCVELYIPFQPLEKEAVEHVS